jgi:tRNA 2-thiouridine synthesizing protein E
MMSTFEFANNTYLIDTDEFLRQRFATNNIVPTVYETCEANHIELEELQRLFPDGYHRGAVKLGGLRVR